MLALMALWQQTLLTAGYLRASLKMRGICLTYRASA